MNTPRLVRCLRWGFCIAVVLSILAGLFISGSPATERRYALDERRVNDLSQISYSIDSYSQSHAGALPETLHDVQAQNPYLISNLSDPETGVAYEYQHASSTAYQLCATFTLPSNPSRSNLASPALDLNGKVMTSWSHGAGRTCFDLVVRLQPTPTIAPLSSAVPTPTP